GPQSNTSLDDEGCASQQNIPAYVSSGSKASDRRAGGVRGMSAVPLIATQLCLAAVRRLVPTTRPSAPQQKAPLFDHVVGALLEEQRHIEAQRLGSLKIDRQLELDRGLDGKLARLLALENAVGI